MDFAHLILLALVAGLGISQAVSFALIARALGQISQDAKEIHEVATKTYRAVKGLE
jgi:hypothetical protein